MYDCERRGSRRDPRLLTKHRVRGGSPGRNPRHSHRQEIAGAQGGAGTAAECRAGGLRLGGSREMSPAAAMPIELAPIIAVEAPAAPAIGKTTAKVEERRTSPTSNWCELVKVHEAAEQFPLLEGAELDSLVEDIEANGLKTPIVTWFDKNEVWQLIDGRNRLAAMARLGYHFSRDDEQGLRIYRPDGSEEERVSAHYEPPNGGGRCHCGADPVRLVISYNIKRRYLKAEQREAIAKAILARRPERSNRSIAKETNLDHKTIGKLRQEGEANGEVPHKPQRTE